MRLSSCRQRAARNGLCLRARRGQCSARTRYVTGCLEQTVSSHASIVMRLKWLLQVCAAQYHHVIQRGECRQSWAPGPSIPLPHMRSEGRLPCTRQKDDSSFEVNLTQNNLVNMARFESHKVSCECAVLQTKKKVLHVECKTTVPGVVQMSSTVPNVL